MRNARTVRAEQVLDQASFNVEPKGEST